MMRKLIYIIGLIAALHANGQTKKEEVIIAFDSKQDSVLLVNNLPKYVWIKNPLYEQELAKYKKISDEVAKDTLDAKGQRVYKISFAKRQNVYPSEYYKFYILNDSVANSECERLSKKKEYSKEKLDNLSARNSIIYIMRNDSAANCIKVSFYQNVME